MVQECLISGIGLFEVSDTTEEVTDNLCEIDVEIGRSILKVGEETDLDGYYNIAKPIYAGYKKNNNSKELYFYYGIESDMFREQHYFQIINLISKERIFITFSNTGGRDFNFIDGKWDWERKSSKIKNCNYDTNQMEKK